jgi:hypothetical protein
MSLSLYFFKKLVCENKCFVVHGYWYLTAMAGMHLMYIPMIYTVHAFCLMCG